MSKTGDRLFSLPPLWIIVSIIISAVAILYAMGRVPICTCGTVKLWQGTVASSENSQHLTDWYTFSHVIHGFLFYALMWALFPDRPLLQRLAAAVAIEAGWEIVENTPLIIDRYRTATIALDYYGDSIINSVADILAMMLGFWLSSILPVPAIVSIALFFEGFTGYVIRDNLTLNVLMLLYPLDPVRAWQSGG